MAPNRVLIVGYGCIGQGLAPLFLRCFGWLQPKQVSVIGVDEAGRASAQRHGFRFHARAFDPANYQSILQDFLASGDLLINVSVDVSSYDLVRWCQSHGVLYLDTCVEPWAGGYDDAAHAVVRTTNYWLREQVLGLRGKGKPTAVIAHGANPGLISHFVKRGLVELARTKGIPDDLPFSRMAMRLGVRAIHIAERDTQHDDRPLKPGEFANTWSVDGLLSEAWQRAELGWGTHEQALPPGAREHDFGCRSGVFLAGHSATVKIKSWVPSAGPQSAYLITHHEALSIADFLTVRAPGHQAVYRPTVLYAYHPSEKTCLSLENWIASGFAPPSRKTLMRDNLRGGHDELGALFLFDGGAYWYGSTLEYHTAADIAPCNNATSIQVAAGIIGALQWMMRHPHEGVLEAEDLPSDEVLSVAMPGLGRVQGVATDWQPAARGRLQFADFLETCPTPWNPHIP